MVGWKGLNNSKIFLHTDGSFMASRGKVAVGGVVRKKNKAMVWLLPIQFDS